MSIPGTPRQYYMDMLKGAAIYMVVMGHVLTLCIGEINDTLLFRIIGEIHMPLFFFISGWFTFKRHSDGTPFRTPDLWQRTLQLLVPMVIVSSIWIFVFRHSGLQCQFDSTWRGLWTATYKNGYWFPLCLFELMLIYAATSYLFRRIPAMTSIGLVFTVWALLMTVSQKLAGTTICNAAELELVTRFYPVFMAGAIARMYEKRFLAYVHRPRVYTAALAASGFLLYMICYFRKFGISDEWLDIVRIIFHITLATAAIPIACGQTSRTDAGLSRTVRFWTYLGRESLAIYLLHYLFLFPMEWLRAPLRDMGLGFVPAAVTAGIAAAAIIGCVLAANAIISRSPLLAMLLTGKTQRASKSTRLKFTTLNNI